MGVNVHLKVTSVRSNVVTKRESLSDEYYCAIVGKYLTRQHSCTVLHTQTVDN